MSREFTPSRSRSPVWATLVLLALLVAGILAASEIQAHHPGSHAVRIDDGRVRLSAAITVSDACTDIRGVAPGAPTGSTAPATASPVTVRLGRDPAAICAQVTTVRRRDSELAVPASVAMLHLYVMGADGRLLSTERVRIGRG